MSIDQEHGLITTVLSLLDVYMTLVEVCILILILVRRSFTMFEHKTKTGNRKGFTPEYVYIYMYMLISLQAKHSWKILQTIQRCVLFDPI